MARLLVLVLLAALAALARPARAESASAKEVRAHYDRGMARYAVGDFEGAIGSFKQAYELSRAPGFLFNLAQASRLARKHADALHFYRTYLRLRPNAANKRDVQAFIAQLEPVVAREAAAIRVEPAPAPAVAVETPATAPAPEPEPVRAERRPDPSPARVDLVAPPSRAPPKAGGASPALAPAYRRNEGRRAMMIGGAVTAAVGVAALAAGIAFGVSASSAQQKVDDLAAGRGTWSAASQQIYDDGRRDANVATALYAAGGALAGVGTVLAIVGWRRGVAQRRYSLTPTASGGMATFSCDF
ncbi:MAG TPA: hypothetical protein VMZ28_19870 [Kofleriaceae bacterium]|nr:hypothetical protein [Kofleriaceae bacterium]